MDHPVVDSDLTVLWPSEEAKISTVVTCLNVLPSVTAEEMEVVKTNIVNQ